MSEEKNPSLGGFLRSERERRGLTVEQTSSATKIGLKVLKQLEEDRYSELPALPFVRGFVRNYAKFLGLDSEKLLVDYAGFLDEHSRERPKRDVGHSGYAFERPEGEQSKKILWGVMASMLLFGGAVVFIFKPSLKHKHHGPVDKLRASPGVGGVADGEGMTASPGPSPSVFVANSPHPNASPSLIPSPGASGIAVAVVAAPHPAPTASPTPSPTVAFVAPKVPLVLAPSPSVVAVVTPRETPHVASPTPAPSLAASPVATVATDPAAEDLKVDPLQSGKNYAPKEVKFKLIFRTKADAWVRYRCDDKQLMKFSLKKDKILVLRAKTAVRFQTSNPDAVTFQNGSGGEEKAFSQVSDTFEYVGNTTLAYPTQEREKMGENFKVGRALPAAPVAAEGVINQTN